MFDYDKLVGSIYDCAANPELWPQTLTQIRDQYGAAFATVGFYDNSQAVYGHLPIWVRRNSPWDEVWLEKLNALIPTIPEIANLYDQDIDTSWAQLQQIPEEEFKHTEFYKSWVKPQKLRDTITVQYLKRGQMMGVFSMPTPDTRPPFTIEERQSVERLTPHIRRAMLINDITDKGNMALLLYRKVLDSLSVAVFVVGLGQRITFANGAAQSMLSNGNFLKSVGGMLVAPRLGHTPAIFDEALNRAIKGDTAIGITGIGLPLIGNDGEKAAAYVLPLAGKDLRGALGAGQCLVFVARRGEQQPFAIEILRSVYDLTPAEARVSVMIAAGETPQTISEALNISINTLRTHLHNAFAKTDTSNQSALCSLVNSIVPPLIP